MQDAGDHRRAMVQHQIIARGICDARVIAAMGDVPREAFVPDVPLALAYADGPLPIGMGQTISQPYIVALMIEAAGIKPGDRILEVGAGSGYAAAIIGRIAGHVYAIERIALLADRARRTMAALGYANVTIPCGDGTKGWPAAAPYDAILIPAAAPVVPPALFAQLETGGRLVMPVGQPLQQTLMCFTRHTDGGIATDDLGGVRFVPLIG
ncbi:protein-L-isoaspartate(D-aspartate) O-methyltransferase [Sphingomonas sp. KC8]|uniref:protein-L-isoaspartate(D-aspartate) O-methyltransferase n=1 Tax=Sphingomonas sp. KC8 TaxID=1030157 RepID=UPI0002488A86|nr:protein-L-isoaspartate(D-aspartate) O-methyltransferase [Sphingomonas sp. KC8]ARS27511.1 protein-L-isoaspartate O-methyltransferase [Sphingomonas sp. KC8]